MRAALDDLATQAPAGRRVAVLGDMLELGAGRGATRTARSARYAASSGVDVLVAVGPLSTRDAARRSAARRTRPPTPREAAALAAELVRPGDVVLVKALARDRPGDRRGGAGPWVRS